MPKFRWETEFKETEIGKIPKDWDVKTLGDVIKRIVKGKVPKKPKKSAAKTNPKDLCPYLSVEYLRGEKEETEYFPCSWGVQVKENDILIIWDGAANAGEIIKAKHGILGSTLALLDVDTEKVDRFFLYSVLKFFENELKSLRSGTDDRHVDKQALLDFLIPYPSPEEQTHIATVLSWFDDLIENKKKQNEILEKMAMAIFKSWFIDFEPFQDEEFVYSEELNMEIPKGWDVGTLGCLVDEIMSGRGKYYMIREIQKEESKMNSTEELYPLWGANGVLGYVSGWDLEGWIILTGRVGTLGKVFITTGRVALSDNVFGILPKQFENTFYIYLWLKLMIDFESLNVGSTQPLITKKDLENLCILHPPQPTLQRFHSLVKPLFQKILLNQKQILTLKKIRDTLLPQLVFGRLRIEEM